MTTPAQTLDLAMRHHQRGDLTQAEELYRQILEVDPHHLDALQLLGVLAHQQGKDQLAIEYFSQAVRLNPSFAEAHYHLGRVLTAQGRLAEAVTSYEQALRLHPEYAEAHNNLAVTRMTQGRLEEAVASYQKALRLQPDYVWAHYNLGMAWSAQGQLEAALASYQQALRLKPDFAEAHYNLALTWKAQGKLAEADASFQQTLRLQPDNASAHFNLGVVRKEQGLLSAAAASYRQARRCQPGFADAYNNLGIVLAEQRNLDEAAACFQQAVRIKPEHAEAYYNLGLALKSQGKLAEAILAYQQAVRLKPDFAQVHNNLGIALMEQGRLEEALACYRETLRLKPDSAEAYNNLGTVLQQQGQFDEAILCYQQALQLNPDNAATHGQLVQQLQHVCAWENLGEPISRLVAAIANASACEGSDLVSPFVLLALPTTAAQQWDCARAWAKQFSRFAVRPGDGLNSSSPRRRSQSKITLGYLSADFRTHALAYLIAELLEKHDRERFAVVGYSYGPNDQSAMRGRLVKACDQFVDLRETSFDAAARRIAADGVDILVDLTGYTRNARTQILALHPASIQVNYLGYPGTMGASFMDYILVDDFIVPADQQPYYTEKLVHLPGCYQVNDSQRAISPDTPSRAECSLPEGGFVFCCFNNSYKITPEMFTVWMELLKAVPGSVLWLLEGNRYVPANLRREAEARGVPAERLVFAPRRSVPEHLARHRLADLFLDTFPYNAHTTASDSLWAGCPVLTLAGETFVSRVAGSLLRALGLPELITTRLADYHALALRVAQNAQLLRDLRARLEANRAASPLFDGGQFARNIERAYATMWEIHAAGERPRPFAVRAT